MADFALIKDRSTWVNLDYVIRIDLDVDDAGAAEMIFADGTTFTVSHGEGKRLAKRLQTPQKKKKKKKKKAPGASEASGPETSSASPAA